MMRKLKSVMKIIKLGVFSNGEIKFIELLNHTFSGMNTPRKKYI